MAPDPLHMAEISDQFDHMKQQEETTYKPCDYLKKWMEVEAEQDVYRGGDGQRNASCTHTSGITEEWREKIVNWSYDIADFYHFNRETVYISLSYLDRFLATRSSKMNNTSFQLAAVTTINLAIKLYEHNKMDHRTLVSLCRGKFQLEDIVRMEMVIMRELNFYLHPPTPIAFCSLFLSLFPENFAPYDVMVDVGEVTNFLTELAVLDYWFVTKKPSSIALGAIMISLEIHLRERVYDLNEFFSDIAKASGMLVTDVETVQCRDRLWETYVSGGYASSLQQPQDEQLVRFADSPVCVSGAPRRQDSPVTVEEQGDDAPSVSASATVYTMGGNDQGISHAVGDSATTAPSQKKYRST
mmetsp:Transcript_29075/g.45181  ORF Transcript_29075/g.45181 Transcript_29075/m.45181 type:complete len:356 (-) Transcript_29075:436-1503(-)|eukprot:CAMPEP_0196801332 /NCGR_PEP_ID=MMETSP1362-20130617/1081_1 /TAXON_ID=163516 /ORGANISM="Leptocylindrus danicus, Strain CCMP1856" /LENGTH=355 /DNA_ID=CAMNT_0042172235 /DNA_START=28 /DNA_END=1095 /DNA_ORIENTATION=+